MPLRTIDCAPTLAASVRSHARFCVACPGCRWWTNSPHAPTPAANRPLRPPPSPPRTAPAAPASEPNPPPPPRQSASSRRPDEACGCRLQPVQQRRAALLPAQRPAAPFRYRSPDEPAAEPHRRHRCRTASASHSICCCSQTTGVSPCRTTASASSAQQIRTSPGSAAGCRTQFRPPPAPREQLHPQPRPSLQATPPRPAPAPERRPPRRAHKHSPSPPQARRYSRASRLDQQPVVRRQPPL